MGLDQQRRARKGVSYDLNLRWILLIWIQHWTYGAERAKDREVLFTMGMRGDGDEPLSGASIGLVESKSEYAETSNSSD